VSPVPFVQPSSYIDETDYSELVLVGKALRQIPEEFRRQVRPALQHAGTETLHEAIWRASAFSERIPHALSLSVSFASRKPGVTVRASLKVAPHARTYEGFIDPTWRHPVFGHYETWVEQAAKPYLMPAVELTADRFLEDVRGVLNDVNARLGLV